MEFFRRIFGDFMRFWDDSFKDISKDSFFWVFFLDELEEEMILDYYLVANHPTLTHEIFVCLKNALVVLV